jgi:hypothetical protein
MEVFFSFTIKIYPYLIVIPVLDLATECIYNDNNSAYIAIGAINIVFALLFSFVQAIHEVNLDFTGEDILYRRHCLSVQIGYIDPFITCLLKNVGSGVANNVTAMIFMGMRLVEAFF